MIPAAMTPLLAGFAMGVGNRVATLLLPTALDKEQIRNLRYQREMMDKQLRAQEQRAEDDWKRLRIEIDARIKLMQDTKRWEAWPLVVHAADLAETSVSQQKTSVLVVHRPRGKEDKATYLTVEQVLRKLSVLNRRNKALRDQVLFYHTALVMHPQRPTATGDLLVAHLWPFLKSLPFVLAELTSSDSGHVQIDGAIWGYDDERGADMLPTHDIDFSEVEPDGRDDFLVAALHWYLIAVTDILNIARSPVLDGLPSSGFTFPDAADSQTCEHFAAVYLPLQLGISERAPLLGIANLLAATEWLVRHGHVQPAKTLFEAATGRFAELRGVPPPEPWFDLAAFGDHHVADGGLLKRFGALLRLFPADVVPLQPERPPERSLRDVAKALKTQAPTDRR